MSDGEQPREVVDLPLGVVRSVHLVVQCATPLADPDEENPAGTFCGCLIESQCDVPYEPGMAVEVGIECPACSKRISETLGHPVQAILPVALLVGQEIEDSLPTAEEAAEEDGEPDGDEAYADDEDEDRGVVEVTPEDQGG